MGNLRTWKMRFKPKKSGLVRMVFCNNEMGVIGLSMLDNSIVVEN